MKVFVGGSKTITYLKDEVKTSLDTLCDMGAEFLIGDCFGADKLMQQYLYDKGYRKVTVYVSGERTRNNIGGFIEKHINAEGLSGFEFYRQKDIVMAEDADRGLMLWDGKTMGTSANIQDMRRMGKEVTVIKYE